MQEDDAIDIIGLTTFAPNTPLTIVLHHKDGTIDQFMVNGRMNGLRILSCETDYCSSHFAFYKRCLLLLTQCDISNTPI